jgi:hypothetical protein
MSWIKRNLAFVISLAVAVALLIGGAVYLLSAQSEAEGANGELEAKKNEYDTLVKREPYPNAKNIELAKAEQVRVAELKAESLATFSQYPTFTALDDASFKALLTRTIADLERSAERRGVKLPTGSGSGSKYNFTFDTQRRELRLAPNTLQPLALALTDIREFTDILFASKIHSLVSIKRTAIGTNETAGSGDILSKKVGTNSVVAAGIHPYEVQFQCFSSELGEVLSRLVAASNAYVLKTINVERPSADGADGSADAAQPNPAMGMMALMGRYGLRPGMGTMPPATQPSAAQPAASGKVGDIVLEQKPIKVTLGFEVVRLAPPPAAAQAPKATRR